MTVERVTVERGSDVVPVGSLTGSLSCCSGRPAVPGFDEHPAHTASAARTGATRAMRAVMAIRLLCLSRAARNRMISRDVGAGARGESLAAGRGYAVGREMVAIRKFASRCAFRAGVYSPRVLWRAPAIVLVAVAAIAACNQSGAVVPVVPGVNPAMLDAYDASVLASTESVAPTFDEVKEPRDESPRRFRAWLGWNQEPCAPCAADEQSDTACAPCPGPKPY